MREVSFANAEERLETIEARFLDRRRRQLAVQRGFAGYLDMSAASHMHLHEDIYPQEFWGGYDGLVRETVAAYPSLHSDDRSLERAFADALRRWTGADFGVESIVVFPGGVYGSYSPVLSGLGRPTLLVPELIHQTHKTCFALSVADIREVPMDGARLLDLAALERSLSAVPAGSATVFIHHNRAPAFDRRYFEDIAVLLVRYDAVAVYDADTLATSHDGATQPSLPLRVPGFIERALVLVNMTKEYGLPGLRVGFGIGNPAICARLRQHMKAELRMMPPVTRAIALRALACGDLGRASEILRERLGALVGHFGRLGWPEFPLPAHGINVFVPVPRAFMGVPDIPADELFYYWALSRAGVLLRPAGIYGPSATAEVRPTLSVPVAAMAEAFARLEEAGLRYDMPLPPGIAREYIEFLKNERL